MWYFRLIILFFSVSAFGQPYYYSASKDIKYGGFDEDAQAYFDVVTDYTEPQKILINDLIVTLKEDNVWSNLRAFGLFLKDNLADIKWNLKDLRDLDAAYRLTASGSGHVYSTDGFRGDSSGLLDSHLATNTLNQDDNHISIYSSTGGGIAGSSIGSYGTGFANALYISYRWSDDNDYSRNAENGGSRAYGSDTGFFLNRRNSSSEYKLDRGASGTITVTATSVALNSNTIYIGAVNTNGGASAFDDRLLRMYSIGDGLNDTEAAAFKTAIDAFFTAWDGLAATLLFSTGFDGISFGTPNAFQSGYTTLSGTDSETGYTFSNTSPQLNGSLLSAFHMVNSGGATLTNEFVTVTGHTGASTTALRQEIIDDPGVSQIPFQINNISWNGSEYDIDNQLQNIYVRQWRKLRASDLDVDYDWAVLWEYKTYHWDDSEGEGYRIISDIQRDPVDHKLYAFHRGDIGQGVSDPSGYNFFFKTDLTTILPDPDEWFLLEYYVHFGDGLTTGKSWTKINGSLIGENTGRMTVYNTDFSMLDPIAFLFLTQMYGGNDDEPGEPGQEQYIDDIEIWNGVPL